MSGTGRNRGELDGNAAREQDAGLLTIHYQRQLGCVPARQLVVGKSESCRADLLSFLRGAGVWISERFERDLLRRRKVNRSRHDAYDRYYDDDLRDLVARKERMVISEYGYTYY